MHPRTYELLSYLDTQRTVLRAAVDLVPPDLREYPPADGQWSVANVLEHLSIVEQRVALFLSKMIETAKAEGLGPETSTDPLLPSLGADRALDRSGKVMAPDALHPTGLKAPAAWSALEQAGEALRDAVRSGDGLALGTLTRSHPIFGPLTLYQWIAFAGAHEARHADQIRSIVSSRSRN